MSLFHPGGLQRDCLLRVCCCSSLPWVWVSIGKWSLAGKLSAGCFIRVFSNYYKSTRYSVRVSTSTQLQKDPIAQLLVLTQSKGGGDLWERKPGRGPGRHNKSSTSPENLSLHNGRPAQVMWILLWWYQKNAAISLSGWNAFGVEEYSKSTCVVHVKQNLLKRKKLVKIAKLKSMCRKTARKKRQKREVEMRN